MGEELGPGAGDRQEAGRAREGQGWPSVCAGNCATPIARRLTHTHRSDGYILDSNLALTLARAQAGPRVLLSRSWGGGPLLGAPHVQTLHPFVGRQAGGAGVDAVGVDTCE